MPCRLGHYARYRSPRLEEARRITWEEARLEEAEQARTRKIQEVEDARRRAWEAEEEARRKFWVECWEAEETHRKGPPAMIVFLCRMMYDYARLAHDSR